MKKNTLYLAALLTLVGGASQAQTQGRLFAEADDLRETATVRTADLHYSHYRVLRLDAAALQARLVAAPLEFGGGSPVEVALPLPHGGTQAFAIFESPVLSPALAAQNPGIKTYTGKAVSGPATVRFSFINGQFSAVFFDADQGREVYVQPLHVAGQPTAYLCYSTADVLALPRTGPNAGKNMCGTANRPGPLTTGVSGSGPLRRSSGPTLRTYRLAVATTTNFTAQKGIPAGANTQAAGLAGVVDYVNVLKGVYRRELSIDFTLVSNTNTVTTPTNNSGTFTNGDDTANLAAVQPFLDAQLGNGNYDVGHVLDATLGSSSGGGVALQGVVCDNTNKGQGVSSVNAGDATFPRIYGDQVFAHEVGHQFGMSHTFNSSIPVCTTRTAATSVEPGSGTTIMSYGYTCSNAPAPGNDDYVAPGTATGGLPLLNFHAVSLAQAIAYLATTSCGTSTATGNAPVVVGTLNSGLSIPKSTPFMLTGTASGGAGTLSYSWEGTDVGATAQGGTVPITEIDDNTKAPFFRTYAPTTTGSRTFPLLAAILNGTNEAKGDKLPSLGRSLALRLTVRDGLGGVGEANATLTVASNSGPFLETTNLAGSYTGGQAQAIAWSVNNTTAAPVSCATVDILLSTDGGQTFPYTLASATPNDGTEVITMPGIPMATTQGRIMVRGTGNVFFDISNSDFSLAATAAAAPVLVIITPNSGPVGTSVTFTGGNLTGITGVDFNGTAATVFSTGTGGSSTATVPASASTGNVTITTAGGTSNPQTFTVTAPAGVNLTVSTGNALMPTPIPGGTYDNITVTGTGVAILAGPVVVNTSFVVQSGGGLNSGCQTVTGAGTFTLDAGGTLAICDANGITGSGNSGSIRTTGRSFSSGASYVYTGPTAQVTGNGLPAQVLNLATSSGQLVTLTQPVAVKEVLGILAAGNLSPNGLPLTLLSDAAGTALVVNNSTGAVIGSTATMQRHLTTSNLGLGYRHYSSPMRNIPGGNNFTNDLTTSSFTPVLNAGYNTSLTPNTFTPFPNVFGYDQSRLTLGATGYSNPFDYGWFSPSVLAVGKGYAVNIAGTELVDFTGTPHNGNYTVSLTRNSGATAATAGWALVGNPYPAPISWAAVLPTDRPNLDGAMYVFSSNGQYGGGYRTNVNNMGSSDLIGSSQGFFVRVSSGQTSGSLIFRNSQRVTSFTAPNQSPVGRAAADTRPQVQLTLAGNGNTDDLYVYAQAGATAGLDREFDATKLANPSGLNLSATAASGEALAIDGRPAFAAATAATVVPLNVAVPAAGSYTFTTAALANLPAGITATLVDNLTGTRTVLNAGTSYGFATATTTAPGRFYLNLTAAGALASAAATLEAQVQVYPNPAHGQLTLVRPAGAAASAVLFNALGQQVRTLALPTAEAVLNLHGLAPGVYSLRLVLDGQPITKRVVVE